MAEALAYLSEAWRERSEDALAEGLPPERMNHITTSLANVYKGCPDGADRYLYIEYEDGYLTALDLGEGAPPKAEFIVTGDYATFVQIAKGELNSQLGLMTGKLTLKGNMVKALKLAVLADRFNHTLAPLPTTF